MAASVASPSSTKSALTPQAAADKFQSAIDEFSRELLFLATNYKGHNISPEVIRFGRSYILLLPKDSLIDGFIQSTYTYWENIRTQDDSFFVEHVNTLFQGVPAECSEGIRQLLVGTDARGQPIIPAEKKQACWEYVKFFVKQAIKYAFARRRENENAYPFLNDIPAIASKWNLRLS